MNEQPPISFDDKNVEKENHEIFTNLPNNTLNGVNPVGFDENKTDVMEDLVTNVNQGIVLNETNIPQNSTSEDVSMVGAETPALAVEMPTQVETPAPAVEMPTQVETPAPAVEMPTQVETPAPAVEMPTQVETPAPAVEMPTQVETPVVEMPTNVGEIVNDSMNQQVQPIVENNSTISENIVDQNIAVETPVSNVVDNVISSDQPINETPIMEMHENTAPVLPEKHVKNVKVVVCLSIVALVIGGIALCLFLVLPEKTTPPSTSSNGTNGISSVEATTTQAIDTTPNVETTVPVTDTTSTVETTAPVTNTTTTTNESITSVSTTTVPETEVAP